MGKGDTGKGGKAHRKQKAGRKAEKRKTAELRKKKGLSKDEAEVRDRVGCDGQAPPVAPRGAALGGGCQSEAFG